MGLRAVCLTVCLAGCLLPAGGQAASADKKPHILFIVSDSLPGAVEPRAPRAFVPNVH